jgi:predicted lipid-binding transport protein (Tim44 family)
MQGGAGLTAAIGGFILLAVIIAVTIYVKSRKPTARERDASDQAAADGFDKIDRPRS